MKLLTNELLRRFPEVRSKVVAGDDDLPYVMVGHLANWLAQQFRIGSNEQVVTRLVDFCNWCKTQPPGEDADDDIMTIIVVGLYEELFQKPETLFLMPKVMQKDEVVANKAYLVKWIGKKNYQKALEQFK